MISLLPCSADICASAADIAGQSEKSALYWSKAATAMRLICAASAARKSRIVKGGIAAFTSAPVSPSSDLAQRGARMDRVIAQRAAERAFDAVPADRRDGKRARIALAGNPAQLHQAARDRGADRAGKVRTPLAPVDAGAAECAAAAPRGGQIDAEFVEERFAALRHHAAIVGEFDVTMLLERVGQSHAELARDVVVAHACR